MIEMWWCEVGLAKSAMTLQAQWDRLHQILGRDHLHPSLKVAANAWLKASSNLIHPPRPRNHSPRL